MNPKYNINFQTSYICNVLRIIAAETVVVGHSINFFHLFKGKHHLDFPYIESIGVIIFFIISGYLITFSIFSRHQFFYNYFINRFIRIYISLIPCMIIIYLINYIVANYFPTNNFSFNISFKNFFFNLLMLQNYDIVGFSNHAPKIIIFIFGHHTFGTKYGPLWTLSLEWWLYMSIGFLIYHFEEIINFKIRFILPFLICSIVPFYNIIGGYGSGLALIWLMSSLGYFIKFLPLSKIINPIKIFYIILIITFISISRFISTQYNSYDFLFDFLLLLLIFSLLFPSFTSSYNTKYFIIPKVVKFISQYTFTLYLIHFSIIKLIYSTLHNNSSPIILVTINLIFSNIIAILIANFTEQKYKLLINWLYSVNYSNKSLIKF